MADHSWAQGLGLVWSAEPPGVVSRFTPLAEHRGRPGYLHGGLAATVLDETMAALSWVLDRRHSVTATLELRYRLPVPLDGRVLRVEAWRDGAPGRRATRVHGRLLVDGRPAVEATGLFVTLPAEPAEPAELAESVEPAEPTEPAEPAELAELAGPGEPAAR